MMPYNPDENSPKESKNQLSSQVMSFPLPTYTWQYIDNDFKLLSFNKAAEEFTQGIVGNTIGTTAKEMFHDNPNIQDDLKRCFIEEATIKRELSYQFAKVGLKYLIVTYVYVAPDRVMVHTEDITAHRHAEEALKQTKGDLETQIEQRTTELQQEITERKRIEADLRKNEARLKEQYDGLSTSEERYRSLFTLAPDGIMTMDLKGVIKSCNPAVKRLTGFPETEFVGKHFTQIGTLKAQDITNYIKIFTSLLRGKSPPSTTFVFKRKDGTQGLSEARSSVLKVGGKIIGIQAVLRDITKEKRAELALQHSEERFRLLFNNANDAMFLHRVSPEGRPGKFLEVNKIARDWLGYTREELLQMTPLEIGDPDTAINNKELIDNLLMKKHLLFERVLMSKNGHKIPAEVNIQLFKLKNRLVALSIARDISERIKIEQTRLELETKRMNFIEITSHELRTPLTSIRGYSEILGQHWNEMDPETRIRSFDAINRNVHRLENLIDSVTTLGKLERASFRLTIESHYFCKFLNETVQPYQTFMNQDIEYNLCQDGTSTIVEMDATRIQQVLDNIIDNAIKNTSNDNRKITITPEFGNDKVSINISDNGSGIAPENIERIFDQFVTIPTEHSAGGTGIGLYLSKVFVDAHGGSLTVQSKGKGKGSTFIVELPRKSKGS